MTHTAPVEAIAATRRASLICRASQTVSRAEALTGGALVAAIFLILLANALSRGLGRPLIWTDELAVHLMVWLAFIGGSYGIAIRGHMAVGMLPDSLSPRYTPWLALMVDGLVLVFVLAMSAVVWMWLDVPGLIRAGSGAALAQETFNFVWTDPTLTLGIRKVWFWLILPLTCATGLIHALALIDRDVAVLRGRA